MKWLDKYGYEIIVTLAVVVLLVSFVVPFCIGIGKEMWQWALG